MTAIRSYAWGSLLLALLIAMLLAVAVGGAAARADAPAAVADRAAAAPAPQSEWSEDSHPADGVRDRADERDEDSADAASDSDEGRNRNDIEEYFDWGHGWNGSRGARRHRRASHGDTLVNFGSDSKLPAGRHADAVVSIFGSSTSEGDADDVVSILGSTRTSGRVSDSAVAVVGSAYIDGPVGADVVAVLGDVNLGPHADVGGDVTAVGGSVIRDPAAVVRGNVQSVGGLSAGFGWLRPWIDHCLLYGRPLALVSGIGWAWALSIAFLALYVCLALLFRDGVSRCVSTVESEPGMTFVAALLTVLLAPILMVLLCITVIGIAAIPFVVFGLFCAGVFGKAVMLAWIGRRVTSRSGSREHPAVAVLIGGLIVLVLYLIPVVGFLVYKLLGLLGLGAVIYTLLLASRARRAAQQTLAGGPVPAPTVAAESGPVAAEGPTDARQPATASAAAASAGETVAPGAASAAAAGGAPHAGTERTLGRSHLASRGLLDSHGRAPDRCAADRHRG